MNLNRKDLIFYFENVLVLREFMDLKETLQNFEDQVEKKLFSNVT